MTLKVTITEDLYKLLAEAANDLNVTAGDYARKCVIDDLDPTGQTIDYVLQPEILR